MTIHELTSILSSALTASDEMPIWDVEAGNGEEPTKKVTLQGLATALASIGGLVTGVKGDAESGYRTGNVNLTPNSLGIYPFHLNVTVDSNGQGFISFSSVGLSSRPNVCFMEIINVGGTLVRYNYGASTSQIVLEASWVNMSPITSTTVEVQGVAFA